jgi:hypothetical protein
MYGSNVGVTFYVFVPEIFGSNLCWNPLDADWGYSWFFTVQEIEFMDTISRRPLPFPSKSLATHHSPIILPYTTHGFYTESVIK